MRFHLLRHLSCTAAVLALAMAAPADDVHIKKNITFNGNVVSTTETSVKGSRQREVIGNQVTLRQCDLKRTVTIDDQNQTYFIADDPKDETPAAAAAVKADAPKITVTSVVTDTGERKIMWGYNARHLKSTINEDSSEKACTQVHQKYEVDGWYVDLGKDQVTCQHFQPPVKQADGCNDPVVSKRVGSGKPGFGMDEVITFQNGTTPVKMQMSVAQLQKQTLESDLFDLPQGYKQVNSLAELSGVAPAPQVAAAPAPPAPAQPTSKSNNKKGTPTSAPLSNPVTNQVAQQAAMSGAQQMAGAGQLSAMASQGAMAQMMQGMGGAAGMNAMQAMGGKQGGNGPQGTAVAAPQALGAKAPGKIRIGVAPPAAQMGQGTNSGADYSTPIRNSIVLLMSGPAVEIAALDSHVPMQLVAEAQQKQCDYVLYSAVTVKHGGGGFGKFLKSAGPLASMMPMAGMAGGMGGAMAAQTAASVASQAAAQAAQEQAMSQLSGFNGQIKQKDNVTVEYQLAATGQSTPVVANKLEGKAKSDGEDVLTPLIQQTANTVITTVSTKQ